MKQNVFNIGKSGIHFGIQNEINMYKILKNHVFLNMK